MSGTGPLKNGRSRRGVQGQRRLSAAARAMNERIALPSADAPAPRRASKPLEPTHRLADPDTRVYVGDCRDVLPRIPEAAAGQIDLIFADPPFNWSRAYDEWDDKMPLDAYLRFTEQWLDGCVDALAPHGSMWVNIPDDWAAEIVVHLKKRGLHMVNWCVWHYRFGQNTMGRFINSKVHALYFCKDERKRTWNPEPILEMSDRATLYGDARTLTKKTGEAGMRVPMDVWYGKNFGRIQGNNKERRANHDNQIPEVYLERVIRACSNPGDLVLDPFLGSGTTCTVARELGRPSIGIEYSAANAKSAFQRISAGPVRVVRDEPTRHTSAIFEPRRPLLTAGAEPEESDRRSA
ncbi:MAG: DNA-methyltransferase [Phycisphaerales bacterium]